MIGLPAADYGRWLAGGKGNVLLFNFTPKTKKWLSYTDSVPGSCARETKSGKMICGMFQCDLTTDGGAIPPTSTNFGLSCGVLALGREKPNKTSDYIGRMVFGGAEWGSLPVQPILIMKK